MPRDRSRSAPPSFPVFVPSVLDDSEEEETSGLSDLQVRLRKLRRFRKVFNNGQSACADDLTASKQPAVAAAGDQAACPDTAAAAACATAAAAAAAAADEPVSYGCEDVDYWLLLQ
jgi:hypothetical protein